MLNRFWKDERGVILSVEIVLLGTILVLGMIVGLVEVQSAVVAELGDLGDALGNLDQSYQVPGIVSFKHGGSCGNTSTCGIKAATSGASYRDRPDLCDCNAVIVCHSDHDHGEKGAFTNDRAAGGVTAHHGGGVHRGPVKAQRGEQKKRQPVPAVPRKK